jgi:GNAT superfamily N-acetyltransferase
VSGALPPGYTLCDDPAAMQIETIHAYLSEKSYWAFGRSLNKVRRALAGSICVGVFHAGKQVGFVRAVTDKTTMAYVDDVYVLDEHQGRGLAKRMLNHLRAHPDLQGLRRWLLVTQDAQPFYESLGWQCFDDPRVPMRIIFPESET